MAKAKLKKDGQKAKRPAQRAKRWTANLLAAADADVAAKAREIKYDQKDYTVEHIAKRYEKGVFYVPIYQRKTVWDLKNKQAFIESLLLNLPIPYMFIAARPPPDPTHEIVDGAQRITTIASFLKNDFALGNLEKLPRLNGMRFVDLPDGLQQRLLDRALRIVVLDPDTSLDARKELFRRVNTHGRKARAAEVRRGAYEGPFMAMVRRLADGKLFHEACPLTDVQLSRREDEELIVRFFAYSDEYKAFRHDVNKFLDRFVEKYADKFDQERMEREFDATMRFVRDNFPPGGFAKPGTEFTPRVRFEALAVGTNLALRERPNLAKPDLAWIRSAQFERHISTHASNSPTRLRGRIEYVRDQLLEAS